MLELVRLLSCVASATTSNRSQPIYRDTRGVSGAWGGSCNALSSSPVRDGNLSVNRRAASWIDMPWRCADARKHSSKDRGIRTLIKPSPLNSHLVFLLLSWPATGEYFRGFPREAISEFGEIGGPPATLSGADVDFGRYCFWFLQLRFALFCFAYSLRIKLTRWDGCAGREVLQNGLKIRLKKAKKGVCRGFQATSNTPPKRTNGRLKIRFDGPNGT